MKVNWKNDKYAISSMVVFTVIIFLIAILTSGTCDEGDSIMHYLFARYAFAHPENFIHHWAKPFYVLLMSPFAHLGFMCAKLFNATLACISVWFTYLTARLLKYKWAIAVFVIYLFFKTFIVVTFSGLTEPMGNAIMALAIYLTFTRRFIWASLLLSFLPFVRSEGLFLCTTFGLYFIWMRQWRALPILLLGHIVYGIAGYPHFKDFFWTIHMIPYAILKSHYGHGGWLSFAKQMPVIMGMVNSLLLVIGLILIFSFTIYLFIKKRGQDVNIQAVFLAVIFLVFFLMHTTFWALGVFGSFGLIRVFVAISCVMVLIVISALEYIDLILSKWSKFHVMIVGITFVATSVFYALWKLPFAYDLQFDFSLHADQITEREMSTFVKAEYPDYHTYHFFYDAPYIAEVLDLDFFDKQISNITDSQESNAPYPDHSMIIWDDWYSDFEHNTHLKTMRNNKSLREIKTFTHKAYWNEKRTVVLFVTQK
jgi:hypothetical protein